MTYNVSSGTLNLYTTYYLITKFILITIFCKKNEQGMFTVCNMHTTTWNFGEKKF